MGPTFATTASAKSNGDGAGPVRVPFVFIGVTAPSNATATEDTTYGSSNRTASRESQELISLPGESRYCSRGRRRVTPFHLGADVLWPFRYATQMSSAPY